MRVLAVIPAFNEEECLADTVSELTRTCPDIDYLVVNDGSKDGTQEVIERCGMTAVKLPVNTGLTSGFRTGMKYALRHGYDAVVQFDADGQHVPTYIPEMARTLEERDADIVIASRCLDGTYRLSGPRGIGSRLISALIRLTTGAVVTDPTSGMRMYGPKMIDLFARGFDFAPVAGMLGFMSPANFVYLVVIALLLWKVFTNSAEISRLKAKVTELAQEIALAHMDECDREKRQ